MNNRSEKQKMLAGELYNAYDPQLVEERKQARALVGKFNATGAEENGLRRHILAELFGKAENSVEIELPFHCDYGTPLTGRTHF